MVRSTISFLFYLVLLFSCREKTLNTICFQNGYYVDCNEVSILLDGRYNLFRKNGTLKSSVHFTKGIPVGLFKTFGFDGELISTIEFIPLNIPFDPRLNILRITKVKFSEGNYNEVYFLAICDDVALCEKNRIKIFLSNFLGIKEKLKFALGELESHST